MSSVPAPLIYRVNDLELDTVRGCLRRNGEEIHLKPKAFQILVYLLAHRDRLVPKDELLDQFWKDTAVSDDILAQSIAELRRALGDSPRDPLYLKTVPKRGYRFVAGVQEVRPQGFVATEQITTVQVREEYSDEGARRFDLRWLAAGILALVALTALVLWWQAHPGLPARAGGKRQIAVLRFENRSGQHDLDWLCDGLPDMLTTTLSRSPGLGVLSREQAALWLGRIGGSGLQGALELTRRSHAQAAVMGSFAGVGDSIRIDTRIYDGQTGAMLAAESITVDKLERVLTQIDFLSTRLAARVAPKGGDDHRLLASLMTDNLEAYRYYSLGLAQAEGMHIDEAVRMFHKAVALDPNFGMAYARIGYAYAVPGARLAEGRPYLEKAFHMSGKLTEKDRRHIVAWYAIANQDYQQAIRAYSELMAAYPNETEPYYRLAGLLRGESRHEEGVDTLRQALAIDPEDPKLPNMLSGVLSEMGRHNEAIEMAQRYTTLAPADANAYDTLGLAWQMAGQYEKAESAFVKAIELNPSFEIARHHRTIVWMQMGREREALRESLRRADEVSGASRGRYWMQAVWLYWRRGRIGEARATLAKTRQLYPGSTPFHPADATPASTLPPSPGRGNRWGARIQYFYLAEQARAANHPEEMLAHLRELIRHRTSWAMEEPLEDALADGFFTLGRLDEAIAEYERALKVFPGMARARYRLAQSYRQKGNYEAAKAQFGQFLELWKHADPDLPEVVEARRWRTGSSSSKRSGQRGQS